MEKIVLVGVTVDMNCLFFFFSSRRRHTRYWRDWSSDVCSSDLGDDYNTEDGSCVRDYIHVTDLANAHLLALKRLMNGGESRIYNLGNGKGFSVKEVIEVARKVTGKEIKAEIAERRAGDPATLIASSKKAMEELQWKPKYNSLETIIETAWKWHVNHPQGYEN